MAGNKCPMLLFLNLLLQVVLSLTSELSRSMIVKFDPPVLHNLEELKEETVNVTLRFPKNEFEAENVEKFSFQMKSFSPEVASVEEPTLALTRKEFSIQPDNFYEAETVVKVKGNMLGKTGMKNSTGTGRKIGSTSIKETISSTNQLK
ncbi:unnamed protein product [Caenorhabditis auriculariae]|uniref:SbsA Ig-like domain-containing protein n=1 Tax=Caenorhabditis auriculariae TaxID=2777116 RepID=A0A8S1HI97_9PELO|nr:unnamed protein product [Caenorhabditis auriculariae]